MIFALGKEDVRLIIDALDSHEQTQYDYPELGADEECDAVRCLRKKIEEQYRAGCPIAKVA